MYIITAHIYVSIMPFLEVTILFNQHFIIVENIVGKSLTGILTLFIYLVLKPLKNPGRHSNSIYLVLKPLKIQNVWCIFRPSRVFHVYGTANMQNMHVNCKHIFPCTIKQCQNMQTNAISYYRRKFRSETSDNMDSWKAEVGRVRREKIRREKIRRERVRRKKRIEEVDARKDRKVAIHCVFPMICGSGGSKSRLAKSGGCGASWPDETWKSARRCGAKHISKSKWTKH